MSGITLATAQAKLDLWLSAEGSVALGQSVAHEGKALTRANLAQIREDLGQRKEAHEDYRWTTEIIADTGFATRAEHEAAWDGFHRTK